MSYFSDLWRFGIVFTSVFWSSGPFIVCQRTAIIYGKSTNKTLQRFCSYFCPSGFFCLWARFAILFSFTLLFSFRPVYGLDSLIPSLMMREDAAVFIRIHIAKIVVLRYHDDDDTDMTVDGVVVACAIQSFLFTHPLAQSFSRTLALSLSISAQS